MTYLTMLIFPNKDALKRRNLHSAYEVFLLDIVDMLECMVFLIDGNNYSKCLDKCLACRKRL